ncbi:MAG: GYD domain-containing protein [Gammaproteobacteria bacterium]
MATFITLMNFTDQGIRNVKESPDRYDAFLEMAEKLEVTIKNVYWTVGHYDVVMVVEGSEEAATSLLLNLGSLGNVRTQTLRGYTVEEIKRIVSNMP